MAANAHFTQPPSFYHHESFHTSNSPSQIPSLTPASTLDSSHNASPADNIVGEDVLEDSLFPQLKTDEEPNDVSDLQKDDPLGVDVWKFYRKQSQLPDAERMQNMTWRMMTINLRKAQRSKPNSTYPPKHTRGWTPFPPTRTTTARRIAQPRRTNPPAPPPAEDQPFPLPSAPFTYSYPSPVAAAPFDLHTSGPRGSVHLPPHPSSSSHIPPQHPRHISLAPTYAPSFQSGGNGSGGGGGGDYIPWDPNWAQDAFGSTTIWDAGAATGGIKREEEDGAVGGMGMGMEWEGWEGMELGFAGVVGGDFWGGGSGAAGGWGEEEEVVKGGWKAR